MSGRWYSKSLKHQQKFYVFKYITNEICRPVLHGQWLDHKLWQDNLKPENTHTNNNNNYYGSCYSQKSKIQIFLIITWLISCICFTNLEMFHQEFCMSTQYHDLVGELSCKLTHTDPMSTLTHSLTEAHNPQVLRASPPSNCNMWGLLLWLFEHLMQPGGISHSSQQWDKKHGAPMENEWRMTCRKGVKHFFLFSFFSQNACWKQYSNKRFTLSCSILWVLGMCAFVHTKVGNTWTKLTHLSDLTRFLLG